MCRYSFRFKETAMSIDTKALPWITKQVHENVGNKICVHMSLCVCVFFSFFFVFILFFFFYSAYMCLLAAAVCLRSCNIDTSLSYFAARQFIRLSFGKRICFVRILLFEFYWIMPSYVLMSVSLVDDSRSSKCRLFVEDLYYILLFMGVAVVVAI